MIAMGIQAAFCSALPDVNDRYLLVDIASQLFGGFVALIGIPNASVDPCKRAGYFRESRYYLAGHSRQPSSRQSSLCPNSWWGTSSPLYSQLNQLAALFYLMGLSSLIVKIENAVDYRTS